MERKIIIKKGITEYINSLKYYKRNFHFFSNTKYQNTTLKVIHSKLKHVFKTEN